MAALLQCDIVMKGGITSGVVYPRAMSRLSKVYRFRNIGGTSAGAIAAALTAAAEYRRTHAAKGTDPNAGFQTLRDLPRWLATDDNLLKLFRPDRKTAALFWFCFSLAASKRRGWRALLGAIFNGAYAWWGCLFGTLGAAAGVELAVHAHDWLTMTLSVIAMLVFLVLGIFGLPLLAVYRDLMHAVPVNSYGLCTGLGDGSKSATPLTLWLADKIDEVAGRPLDGPPLTFGDLYEPRDEDGAPSINLQMVTTNVTYGRPFTLPIETEIFYFNEGEFKLLFPERVVEWMKKHARPLLQEEPKKIQEERARHGFLQGKGYYPLPSPDDLPVIVAARMSLSFPVLLSAVPLHAIDWSPKANQNPVEPEPHTCWFSDGGLSSNFPIHLFDSPLPSRPTFAINLRGFDDVYQEHKGDPESAKVWMPDDNRDLVHDSRNAVGNIGGFLAAILDSMQNWNDNLQSHVPGFRDRVVQVFLNDKEGGLNLDMPEGVVTALALRGEAAADLLINHYSKPGPSRPEQFTDWQNHRWVRMRTSLAVLEDFFNALEQGYDSDTTPGILSYADLLRRDEKTPPLSYRFSNQQRENAPQAVEKLLELVRSWKQDVNFPVGAPQPNPELKVRPKP